MVRQQLGYPFSNPANPDCIEKAVKFSSLARFDRLQQLLG
jgi:hypothetical protein